VKRSICHQRPYNLNTREYNACLRYNIPHHLTLLDLDPSHRFRPSTRPRRSALNDTRDTRTPRIPLHRARRPPLSLDLEERRHGLRTRTQDVEVVFTRLFESVEETCQLRTCDLSEKGCLFALVVYRGISTDLHETKPSTHTSQFSATAKHPTSRPSTPSQHSS
jgi:hypothetical protein